MAQLYKIIEWHARNSEEEEWGTSKDYIVLPTTHIDAVLGLLVDSKIDVNLLPSTYTKAEIDAFLVTVNDRVAVLEARIEQSNFALALDENQIIDNAHFNKGASTTGIIGFEGWLCEHPRLLSTEDKYTYPPGTTVYAKEQVARTTQTEYEYYYNYNEFIIVYDEQEIPHPELTDNDTDVYIQFRLRYNRDVVPSTNNGYGSVNLYSRSEGYHVHPLNSSYWIMDKWIIRNAGFTLPTVAAGEWHTVSMKLSGLLYTDEQAGTGGGMSESYFLSHYPQLGLKILVRANDRSIGDYMEIDNSFGVKVWTLDGTGLETSTDVFIEGVIAEINYKDAIAESSDKYSKSAIEQFFAGTLPIPGYNKEQWDASGNIPVQADAPESPVIGAMYFELEE